ncbi:DNA polymerase Y family protein [Pacificimonas sp. WHA3]|uniref:DNA polymerase Y family protein n=2 Tax=Pacificimonas pallii TaxID=2827236 RepID=A0ABS6SBZ3_9SPHN|nr:DNA polymerase Y family protein [Pacificimonas pallii]
MERWQWRQAQHRRQASPSAGEAAEDAAPLVLAREGPHGPVIHDVNAAARAADMRPGARVTDMRALIPDLVVAKAVPDQDAADLVRLAHWAQRWCPWTRVDGADALLLDTTGSDHLHGGEAAMLRDMKRICAGLGLTARLALAPTIGAAWALARHGGNGTICSPGGMADALAPLPAAALRLDAGTVLLLRRLGLKTIGSLAKVPREAMVRRFRRIEVPTCNPVIRLDQAMGRTREPLVSVQERAPLRVLRRLAEPLGDLDGLERILTDLAGDLCAVMGDSEAGARGLRFTAFRVDGVALTAAAATSRATRDSAHIVRLFAGKLDRLDPGFGVDSAALAVVDGEALIALQDDLTGETKEALAMAQLVDQLSARLGEDAVMRPVSLGSHIPERGEVFRSAVRPVKAGDYPVQRLGRAPLRLLGSPEPADVIHAVPEGPPARFRWRRKLHDVVRAQGPERIAPEWWREPGRSRLRDYYRVEDDQGRRFWLYREGLLSDGRGGRPAWFVHGLDV